MTRAVLSLGSNLGDRLAHLQSAVDGLGSAVRAVSPVFQTAPWGPVVQDDYLNAIVLVDDPTATAEEWLRRGQRLEQSAARVRAVRFGPRTLDVDVITVDGVSSADPRLTLPHPRAHERAFVLVPWLSVAPDAVLPQTVLPQADLPQTDLPQTVLPQSASHPAPGLASDPAPGLASGLASGPASGRASGPVGLRVADLVDALPPDDVAGVRRRDDLRLTLAPELPRAGVGP